MRRYWTAVVVGAVVLVVVAALADSLRGRVHAHGATKTTTSTVTVPAGPAARLAADGIRGFLYATVRLGGRCRVVAVALPSLVRSPLYDLTRCLIRVSRGGRVAVAEPCPVGGSPSFAAQTRFGPRTFRGCAASWRDGRTLTFVRRGSLVEFREPCTASGCTTVVLPRARVPGRLVDAVWLGPNELAAVVERGRRRSLVLFHGENVVDVAGPCCPDPVYLRALGPDLGMRIGTSGASGSAGILQFDRGGAVVGAEVIRRSLADGRALAASPDGRVVAATSGNRVVIRLPGDGGADEGGTVSIPLRAVDLGWVG